MRKITEQAKEAFMHNKEFKKSNTEVFTDGVDMTFLSLHGNVIAKRRQSTGEVWFNMCGWPTPTTRERLLAAGVVARQLMGDQMVLNTSTGKWLTIEDDVWYKL